jgi:hypothetical protein
MRRSVRRLGELEDLSGASRRQIVLLERDLAVANGRLMTLEGEGDVTMQNSNVLSVTHSELQQAYDRRTLAYDRARRLPSNREMLQLSAAVPCGFLQPNFKLASKPLMPWRCILKGVHLELCMISIQDGSCTWHCDADSPELYATGHEIQNRVPCPFCAQTDLVEVPRGSDNLNAGLRVIHAPDGIQLANLVPRDDQ